MTGRVCPKHEEWCPTGECRWCAPEPVRVLPAPEVPSFAKAAQAMIDAAKARIYAGWMLAPPQQPVPIIMHYSACKQSPCSCPAIAAGHAARGVVLPPAVSCKCGAAVLSDPGAVLDDPTRYWRHGATFCGPPRAHANRAAPQKALHSPAAFHYPSCPLTGLIGDPAQALAAGCTCVPFP